MEKVMAKATMPLDMNPQAGNNIYRLKQVDLDGSISYSHLVFVNVNTQRANFTLSPNPVIDQAEISIPIRNFTQILTIRDAMGRELYHSDIPEGESIHHLNLINLPSGTYFLQLSGNGLRQQTTFIRQ